MNRHTTSGILLLSHCGFSFLEDLIAVLNARGMRSYVLSSLPLAEHRPQRLDDLRQKVTHLYSTEAHELTVGDINRTLHQLQSTGERVIACITVWEGYRRLMAHANAVLGVPDLTMAKIDGLRDKLALRNRLNDAGLSRLRAQLLTPEVMERFQASGGRYFVKPASGIASYGAFPLRAETTWSMIQRIQDEAKEDVIYRSMLNEAQTFLIEEYLVGSEFSFELIVVDGHLYTVGIHEKCEVTETDLTVLENTCTSPPYSIDLAAVSSGIAWIRAMFEHLELDWGCFHVEARFDGERWDLIEINPRVGGSLISNSVKAQNGEHGMLDLWVDLLTAHGVDSVSGVPHDGEAYIDRLSALSYTDDGASSTNKATFFRVYFASPGTVAQVGVREMDPAPITTHILLKTGDKIANTSREVFLGQLLWQLGREERDAILPDLIRSSDGAIEIRYVQRKELILESARS
jgi:hypothetical protein